MDRQISFVCRAKHMMINEGNQTWSKKNKTLIKAFVVVLILFFVWFQLDYMSVNDSVPLLPDTTEIHTLPLKVKKLLPVDSKNISATTNKTEKGLSISDIKYRIEQYNYLQTIYNEDTFRTLQNDSIVIVVQVHDRIIYLRHLIESLAKASDISRALLVFSHDYFDEEINDLIQSIDFCMVMQIFYPYSLQTHPYEFPGEDPKDCPKDINRKEATSTKCNNAQHPDLHGHYREAKITQTKHHWWWKANWVFNQLQITSSHKGLFLFLEEDHYIVEDFIHMLKLMEKTCSESNNHCDMLSLARNSKYDSLSRDSNKVEMSTWFSNMGMALNRSTWNRILDCANVFCKYDDYNWDWTLQYTSENCMKPKMLTMIARGPRLFHIGECGMHHKKDNCDPISAVTKVQTSINAADDKLYPDSLSIAPILWKQNKVKKPNGGWGDTRDHELCLGMTGR